MNSVLYPATRFSELDQLLDNVFPWTNSTRKVYNGQHIKADLSEDDSNYYIRMDVPGITKEDITIEVENKTVSISGERSINLAENEKSLRSERSSGSFQRSVRLTEYVQEDAITATLEHGVLTLTIPKAEIAKARRIEIE